MVRIEGSATDDCDAAKIGDTCFLNVTSGSEPTFGELALKRVGADDFRIDWRASVMFNPMTFAAFEAERPPKPVTFRVSGKLDEAFEGGGSKLAETHYALVLRQPGSSDTIHGYVARERTGGAALEVLENGREHALLVALSVRPGAPPDVADAKVLRTDWRETAEE